MTADDEIALSEGREAFGRGIRKDRNPYQPGQRRRTLWFLGYEGAQDLARALEHSAMLDDLLRSCFPTVPS